VGVPWEAAADAVGPTSRVVQYTVAVDVRIIELDRKMDERGWFLKVLRRDQLDAGRPFGEIYLSVCTPGHTRANHYHERTTEWFCAVEGRGIVTLVDIDSGDRREVPLDAEHPQTLVVPPRIAHAIRSTTDQPLVLLVYADLPYDPEAPDATPMAVA